jgi:diadenosine tetraphosphate (Ap4A) HIT family hydrolase
MLKLLISHAQLLMCAMHWVCVPGSAGSGYRLVSNAGQDSNQEVPHMHVHVVAGRGLGGLLPQA